MLITNGPHTIYPTAAKAQAVIDKMKALDPDFDGWDYRVKADPASGRAIIEVFDDTGERMGPL